MNSRQIFLLIAAIGLFPIALSYGARPQISLDYLFDISIASQNSLHIFRAVMGLYLAFSLFWIVAVFKIELRQAALYSLVIFMLGLAAGRVLSLVVDGQAHWLLLVYLAMELLFGALGILLIKRPD